MSKVLQIGPSGKARVYSSLRAASRVFSGNGSDNRRSQIAERVYNGGGYVGRAWLQATAIQRTAR